MKRGGIAVPIIVGLVSVFVFCPLCMGLAALELMERRDNRLGRKSVRRDRLGDFAIVGAALIMMMILLITPFALAFNMIPDLDECEKLSETVSPDGYYEIAAYYYSIEDSIICQAKSIANEGLPYKRVIYFNTDEDDAKVEWISDRDVTINGHKLNILKDWYDWRTDPAVIENKEEEAEELDEPFIDTGETVKYHETIGENDEVQCHFEWNGVSYVEAFPKFLERGDLDLVENEGLEEQEAAVNIDYGSEGPIEWLFKLIGPNEIGTLFYADSDSKIRLLVDSYSAYCRETDREKLESFYHDPDNYRYELLELDQYGEILRHSKISEGAAFGRDLQKLPASKAVNPGKGKEYCLELTSKDGLFEGDISVLKAKDECYLYSEDKGAYLKLPEDLARQLEQMTALLHE